MSHLLIVGGSTGIGRDIQEHLAWPTRVSVLPRNMPSGLSINGIDAVLFCQRYRPDGRDLQGPWAQEVTASILRTERVIKNLAKRSHPLRSIVVLASVAAVSVEEEQPITYHACKAALVEMVKYYAVTLGPKRIRVNAIIPGLTIKPEARAFYDSHPKLEETYRDVTPLGRMGTVEDLAHLVDFLISDKSSYLTGQTITLDGGIGLRSAWALTRRVSPDLRDLQVTQKRA